MYPMIFLKEIISTSTSMTAHLKKCLEDQMMSISNASMGADMADINNDGNALIFLLQKCCLKMMPVLKQKQLLKTGINTSLI